jgi:hypothetical protein
VALERRRRPGRSTAINVGSPGEQLSANEWRRHFEERRGGSDSAHLTPVDWNETGDGGVWNTTVSSVKIVDSHVVELTNKTDHMISTEAITAANTMLNGNRDSIVSCATVMIATKITFALTRSGISSHQLFSIKPTVWIRLVFLATIEAFTLVTPLLSWQESHIRQIGRTT